MYSDDVCVLSATGTAAIVNSAVLGDISEGPTAPKFGFPAGPEAKGEKPEKLQASRAPEAPHPLQNVCILL